MDYYSEIKENLMKEHLEELDNFMKLLVMKNGPHYGPNYVGVIIVKFYH